MLVKIFYEIDEFCKQFEKQFSIKLLTSGNGIRKRSFNMELCEVMTISVFYHQSGYKTFKDYYEKHVLIYLRSEFPHLVSYNRFLELRNKAVVPLLAFILLRALNPCTGTSYIDSFPLNVCHPRRQSSHKVFKGLAQKGKTSTGWFYGFKLHLVINHKGEIITFYITSGNVADNNETLLLKLTKNLFGKMFGDRGYLINPDLFKKLYGKGVQVITRIRKNMKNKLMPLDDKLLLLKRGVIESVGSILKESLSLEHSRHRSIFGFFCHVFSTIINYNFREKKPNIECIYNELMLTC